MKGSSKSSPIRHLELVNVRYPFHASPVPPFVPPCRYLLALQARTTDTAAVRRGAQPGAGCPCATRRRSGVQLNPPPPASPESSISRGRVETGTPRCRPMCSGEPAPSPQPHRPLETPGDGTPHPLIRSASAMPCTLCILCCYDAKCAVACCASVSVRYLLSRHTLPTDQPPSGVPALPRRHHAVVPGVRFLVDGRSRMTATPNQGLTDSSLSYKMRISKQPLWTSRGPQPPPQR